MSAPTVREPVLWACACKGRGTEEGHVPKSPVIPHEATTPVYCPPKKDYPPEIDFLN